MRRLILCGAAAAGLSILGATPGARADIVTYFKRVFWANNNWAAPYLQQDRASAAAPFTVMAENGWRRQNLLCDYHFTTDGKSLSMAGETRLRWILTQAPTDHRKVFVQKGPSEQDTQARLIAAQDGARRIQGNVAEMVVTNDDTPGRSADEVDAINQAALLSMPAPVMRASTGGSTTAGSSSAGASGGSGSSSGS